MKRGREMHTNAAESREESEGAGNNDDIVSGRRQRIAEAEIGDMLVNIRASCLRPLRGEALCDVLMLRFLSAWGWGSWSPLDKLPKCGGYRARNGATGE